MRFSVPAGAFYLFFSVDGVTDSRQAAMRHHRRGQCRSRAGYGLRRRRRERFSACASTAAWTRSRKRPDDLPAGSPDRRKVTITDVFHLAERAGLALSGRRCDDVPVSAGQGWVAMTKSAIARVPHVAPTAPDARARLMESPGFGKVFSDHMVPSPGPPTRAGTMRGFVPAALPDSIRRAPCSTTPRKSSKV